MDKKYHRGNGEVVKPELIEPALTFPKGIVHQEWDEHISSRPVYAYCDPSLPAGWIEGKEVYQVKIKHINNPEIYEWLNHSKAGYEDFSNNLRRIWIEPKQGIKRNVSIGQEATSFVGAMEIKNYDNQTFPINQPDFQREAEELYPYEPLWYNKKNQLAKRAAHIKAREMSAGEVEELRRENDRLKADNMTHEYNEAEAQRFAPEYERQIREDEANKWREQVRKLREVLGKLREGLIESGLIFAYLEDSTHGKEGELITQQRGKIKQLLTKTQTNEKV